ncbi:MAG: ATPase, T2SS/T4P/T4SS family, partial [Candidatus Pacearchaeota archaeon]
LNGISYAFRRHRDYPWTLPLFIKNKMLNSFSAGLLSFLIDGSRTILIAGTRSSGKSSLLGSLILEIKPKYRIITIEDTPELPVDYFRKIGYDILSMKVRSSLIETSNELSAEEGIRASLRLGDSSLIVGEIRSSEARALYEAMRVGALANVVAGTIHGSSPYSVFDRVVNDLNVPITSFKATDLIAVANPVKTPDGLHSVRRLIQLSEVRKHWVKDPMEEKGFVDLLTYNVEKDELEPTPELINGDSEIIKQIASQVKGWVGEWDNVYDNILLRGKVKQYIVEIADRLNKPELLEGKFCLIANNIFYDICDKVTQEIGVPLSDRVFPLWVKRIEEEAQKF